MIEHFEKGEIKINSTSRQSETKISLGLVIKQCHSVEKTPGVLAFLPDFIFNFHTFPRPERLVFADFHIVPRGLDPVRTPVQSLFCGLAFKDLSFCAPSMIHTISISKAK